ncbi:MAG: potassium channel family protein [Nitrospiraceae bacterium]|nr:potassium channel family protein [Nitrospiraceae bacterium]
MNALSALAGAALILIVLIEGFETVVLPHIVFRRVRLTRFFYRGTWKAWSLMVCGAFAPGRRREIFLSLYGPLSLIILLGLWAALLVSGFALLYYSIAGVFGGAKTGNAGFSGCLYYSGTTFFTLGLGDVLPMAPWAKALTVLEAGTGFGFLAIFINYLPPLNQFFYNRETPVSALSARVGAPVSAFAILDRHIAGQNLDVLHQLLYDWERWASELHESHLAYPVLAYFRSEHEDQSWLMALTAVMDTCAFIMSGMEGACKCQAELTFSMSMHTLTDLSSVFHCPPVRPDSPSVPDSPPVHERLSPGELDHIRLKMLEKGFSGLPDAGDMHKKLAQLRLRYEPYVQALASRFHMAVPPWVRKAQAEK